MSILRMDLVLEFKFEIEFCAVPLRIIYWIIGRKAHTILYTKSSVFSNCNHLSLNGEQFEDEDIPNFQFTINVLFGIIVLT